MAKINENKTVTTLTLVVHIKSNHNVSCNKINALLTTWPTTVYHVNILLGNIKFMHVSICIEVLMMNIITKKVGEKLNW